ncbi:hypothetical protein O7602_04820 [Micromonospora sp. WMMD1128]|uniref:hypothetical protein n=1 Tax=Micromonospora sp. WMMD1128 TaxID=3015150 RepID=UPI00248C0F1A|nr:hypothetical protein [Micromonospora sp. WMMD1128]WBB74872.1 hypothetical protein O7602_04820 [Micromonospora sp. WMMD1128]
MATLKAGDLLHITRAASPQFVKSFHFRVIRVLDWTTFDGWIWLEGYQLDARGDAVARRSIFVMQSGLTAVERHLCARQDSNLRPRARARR